MASRYWVSGGSGTWNGTDTNNWAATSGGASGSSVPTASDDVYFDANSGAGVVTMGASYTAVFNNFDTTGFTGSFNNSNTGTAMSCSGTTVVFNCTFTSATTSFNLLSAGTVNISSNGSYTLPSIICGSTGTYQLSSTFDVGFITITSGTFSTQNNNLTIRSRFQLSNNANAKTVNLGSSTVTMTGTLGFSVLGSNNTINAGTSVIKYTNNSATGKNFAGGGLTYATVWNATAGTGTFTVSGDNTFATFKSDPGRTVKFTSASTNTISSAAGLQIAGSLGNLVTIQSTTGGSAATISIASGTVSSDYLSIKDSTASGGASFYAGNNSTNVSGNTGWTFTAPPAGGTKSLQGVSTISKISSIIL